MEDNLEVVIPYGSLIPTQGDLNLCKGFVISTSSSNVVGFPFLQFHVFGMAIYVFPFLVYKSSFTSFKVNFEGKESLLHFSLSLPIQLVEARYICVRFAFFELHREPIISFQTKYQISESIYFYFRYFWLVPADGGTLESNLLRFCAGPSKIPDQDAHFVQNWTVWISILSAKPTTHRELSVPLRGWLLFLILLSIFWDFRFQHDIVSYILSVNRLLYSTMWLVAYWHSILI